MGENTDLHKVDLQNKTSAKKGVIEIFLHKDKIEDTEKTIFHRMYIPLEPFDSGLENQISTETEIVIDWLELNLRSASNLDGLTLKTTPKDDSKTTIYLGGNENPCDLDKMKMKKIEEYIYEVECELFIEFEYENVAANEVFKFVTQLRLDPVIKE